MSCFYKNFCKSGMLCDISVEVGGREGNRHLFFPLAPYILFPIAQVLERGTAQCGTLALVGLPAGWVLGSAGGSTKGKQGVGPGSGGGRRGDRKNVLWALGRVAVLRGVHGASGARGPLERDLIGRPEQR